MSNQEKLRDHERRQSRATAPHVEQTPSSVNPVEQTPSSVNPVEQTPSSVSDALPDAKPAALMYRRKLPHIQPPDARSVFVTFCTRNRWTLPECVRDLVLKHCLHDHERKLVMHGLVVMPDHVHLVFTPMVDAKGNQYGLAEIMQGIKGASAHSINKFLQRNGHVWQAESFDHILRCDESVEEKVEYICQNPVRRGLAKCEHEYRWLWREWVEGAHAEKM